jgi:hypothetical protein
MSIVVPHGNTTFESFIFNSKCLAISTIAFAELNSASLVVKPPAILALKAIFLSRGTDTAAVIATI